LSLESTYEYGADIGLPNHFSPDEATEIKALPGTIQTLQLVDGSLFKIPMPHLGDPYSAFAFC